MVSRMDVPLAIEGILYDAQRKVDFERITPHELAKYYAERMASLRKQLLQEERSSKTLGLYKKQKKPYKKVRV